MSEFRADDDWEEDEEPEPVPVWRRRKWLLVGLGVVVLLAFLFTRGKPQHAQEAQKGEEPFIGVVVPYQPAKPAPAPVKVADAAPEAAPPPPTMPAFRGQLPTANAPPVRPAMLSYAVPHSDPPEAGRGGARGSAADRPGVPGVEPAGGQGVAGDRRHLSADAGPVALRARYRDRERPARPVAVSSAGAGLQPKGCLVDGGGDASHRPVSVDGPERREPVDGGFNLRPHARMASGSRSPAIRWRTISGAAASPARSTITISSALAGR